MIISTAINGVPTVGALDQTLRAVFPATDDIGCFIRKPVDMDDLVKKINAEIR